jgi:hypothetical protein
MSDLSKKLANWAGEGVEFGFAVNALITLVLLAHPEGRETLKEIGLPGYIITSMFIEALAISAYTTSEALFYCSSIAKNKAADYFLNK